MAQSYSVGVVGCTGAVGKELVRLLGERAFPVSELQLFASPRSAGKVVATPFGAVTIREFSLDAARALDVVFLAVSGSFARKHARAIAAGPGGALVIDNSSALRQEPDVPLVVPEINAHALAGADVDSVVERSLGYSGADMKHLCQEAAMWPIRALQERGVYMMSIAPGDVPPITLEHFDRALGSMRPSVSEGDLDQYIEWNNIFGYQGIAKKTSAAATATATAAGGQK